MTLLHPPLPDDLVTFNVRGRIFQTTLTTLRSFEESILYKMVKYEQQRLRATPESSSDVFFIDRDPDHFAAILRYHDGVEYLGDIQSIVTSKSLLLEAQYYNIQPLEEELRTHEQSPAVKYEYCMLWDNSFRTTSWERDGTMIISPLSEEAMKNYDGHALDGLLNASGFGLISRVNQLVQHKNDAPGELYNWSLCSATIVEERFAGIVLRGDKK